MSKEPKNMTNEEFKEYMKQKELEYSASVKDLIEYLKKNFKPDTKLCYIDCVEGAKYECKHIKKEELGKNRFIYVKKDKERIAKDSPKCDPNEYYCYVDDNDILIN